MTGANSGIGKATATDIARDIQPVMQGPALSSCPD